MNTRKQIEGDVRRREDCPSSDALSDNIITWKVFCDTDMIGLDFEPDNGRFRADSLEECVGFCLKHNPRCVGAVWDPENRQGSQNCWLKRNQGGSSAVDAMQFARLDDWVAADSDCGRIGTSYTSKNDTEYRVLCGINLSTPDVDQLPAQSMAECIDLCCGRGDCAGVT
ncbi:hypothetical protein NLU13_1214 [Sarocladium strictum]|uniref:Apple domain-containing protein n=1 Tax=Sarocladium strictum TaxID=5046 RepID=A0AA39LC58_SARSR|nr:hypothetical protein NLU13_1214 [Sarocladium strictum]